MRNDISKTTKKFPTRTYCVPSMLHSGHLYKDFHDNTQLLLWLYIPGMSGSALNLSLILREVSVLKDCSKSSNAAPFLLVS